MFKSVSSIDFIPASDRLDSHHIVTCPGRFLFGPENALLRVVFADIDSLTARYSPMVFFGPTGVGKSHYAHGLAARFKNIHPSTKIVISTAADFARCYAEAVELDSLAEFRANYRGANFFVVDDLHQIGNKFPAQLELMHTLDDLSRRERHVFVTARSCLSELRSLLPSLRSRLAAGLSVPVVAPSAETRRVLLRQLAENNSVILPGNVIDALVEGTHGDPSPLRTVPELRNAIFQLHHGGSENDGHVNIQATLDFLAGRVNEVKPSLRQVTKQVAHYFRLKVADLTGPSRRQAPVRARGIAMYLVRELTGASFQAIGRQFDRRDHTTVLHACRRTKERIQTDSETKQAVEELLNQFCGSYETDRRSSEQHLPN